MEVQQLDLADLSNVRSFANSLQSEPRIDMLILNAGVAGLPLTYTKDNFEMQVGTNHFGHFVLVQSLLDKLKQQVKTASGSATMQNCTIPPRPVLHGSVIPAASTTILRHAYTHDATHLLHRHTYTPAASHRTQSHSLIGILLDEVILLFHCALAVSRCNWW